MIRDQDNSHSPAPLVQGQLSAENDGPRRRVPFELRETSCAGQYLITTEDAEMLQEILDIHMEKPGVSSNGRFLFRDLKFTRQLSTFDRQNPTFSSSQFHGFFVLFWLGVVLLLVKVAANNWRIYGTLWGKNEILCLMFHKDVLVLGVTDLVLCWSPTLCLVLQWAVFKGYLRWSRTGWIVQNVGPALQLLPGIHADTMLDLASDLPGCCNLVDLSSRLAMDAHRFHRSTLVDNLNETAQLCFL